jgi:hypothetical protein
MISAILAKLFTSLTKVVGYSRFFKLAVGCLDLNCCLFSGIKLIVLLSSAPRLLMVQPEDKCVFMICLLSRLVVILVLLWLALEKQFATRYKLDIYRCGAYLTMLSLCALMKYTALESSPVLRIMLFDSVIIGLCYTFVLLIARLCNAR